MNMSKQLTEIVICVNISMFDLLQDSYVRSIYIHIYDYIYIIMMVISSHDL